MKRVVYTCSLLYVQTNPAYNLFFTFNTILQIEQQQLLKSFHIMTSLHAFYGSG